MIFVIVIVVRIVTAIAITSTIAIATYCCYNDYIVVAVVVLQCRLHLATLKYAGACWLGYCAQHGSCECHLFPISMKMVCILQKELLKYIKMPCDS